MPQRLCLLFCLAALPAAAVDFGRIRPDEVSFFVQDLQSGKVLAEHRADVPLNPASTMKLVTAYAALRALGGGFRWQTEFKSAAPLRGNLLDGDLYWTGSGDPMFDIPDLLEMQAQLGDNGVRHIGGRLVFDRSLWPHTGSSYGFANDAEHAFTTAPDPQMLAYKVVRLTLRRGADGSLTAQTTPPLPEVPLYNRAVFTASPAPCPKPRRFLRGKYENGILSVQGSAPPSCAGKDIYVNMFGTQEFARRSFATYWRQGGGILADGAAAGKTPAAARTLARVQSRPLREVLAEMNKHSNNIIARTVFLTIGREAAADKSRQNPAAAVRAQLLLSGIPTAPLVLENGSGLSRRERISARMMGEILAAAYHSPLRQEFADSLPAAGYDGTLKSRFRHIGRPLRLKTGTLANVRALAGYYLGHKPVSVVVIINSPRAGRLLGELDRLTERLIFPPPEPHPDGGAAPASAPQQP